MAEDFELAAAISVEDTSELDDLGADVGAEGDGGAGGGAAAGGLAGVFPKQLSKIAVLLSRVIGLVALVAVIPGLLSGITRLLEIALLPIGILFQNLLAPVLQSILRFFATSNIVEEFARIGQQTIDFLVKTGRQIEALIDGFERFLSNVLPGAAGGAITEDTFATGVAPTDVETGQGAAAGTVAGGALQGNPLPFSGLVAPLASEFTASTVDDLVSASSQITSKEDGS